MKRRFSTEQISNLDKVLMMDLCTGLLLRHSEKNTITNEEESREFKESKQMARRRR